MDASGEMQGSIHVGLMAQSNQRIQETGYLSILNAFSFLSFQSSIPHGVDFLFNASSLWTA